MSRSHRVDISGLLGGGRQVMLVDDEVPIEEFEGTRFANAAKVHLQLRYVDRLLHIEGTVDADALGICDSCMENVDRDIHVDIDERLDPHADREGDPFGESNVLSGNRLDVADLAQQLVLSAMPMGLRCSENCKGLCGMCGANKNVTPCSCADTGPDEIHSHGGAEA